MEDLLFQCAESYMKLTDYEYYMILDNPYKELTISFSTDEFMHLSSIQKLNDLWEIQNISSKKLIELILSHRLSFKRIKESIHYSKIKFDSYSIEDRLVALKNLHDYMFNITSNNTSIYCL